MLLCAFSIAGAVRKRRLRRVHGYLLLRGTFVSSGSCNLPPHLDVFMTRVFLGVGTFDVIGSDPYPIGEGNATAAGVHEEVNSTVALTDDARLVSQPENGANTLIQCFGVNSADLSRQTLS